MAYDTSHLLTVGDARTVYRSGIRSAAGERIPTTVDDLCTLPTAATASSGWKLKDNGTGLSEQDQNFKLAKYSVQAGQFVHVSSSHHWQFQSDLNVPASGTNSNLIGPEYDAGEFAMYAPSGAKYIIISLAANDSTDRVFLAKCWTGFYEPIYNSVAGGIYIDGDSIKTNAQGFGIQIDGQTYYIAPTDGTTNYTFTAPQRDNGYYLMIDASKVTNRGARNNPDTCLKIVQRDDVLDSKFYIPVAFYFKGNWKFIGKFVYFDFAPKRQFDPLLTAKFQFGAHGVNTVAAVAAAKAAGFTYMECDVQYTSDGVAVMNHDGTITVGGTTYTISSTAYATLAAAYSDLATLDELLLAAKAADLCFEIDTTHITLNATRAGDMYAIVKKRGMLGATMFTVETQYAWNLLSYDLNIAIALSGMTSTTAIDGIANIAHMAGVSMLSCGYASISDSLVQYAHNAGCRIRTWMVESAENLATVQGYGIDGILTDTLEP